jgi:D-alanyl-D-alanine carboxypeptidase
MNSAQIKDTQRIVGAEPDGFWGPKSTAATQRYLRSLMPKPNPWPGSSQAALTEFYGKAGDESRLVNLPSPVPMFYEGKRIKTIRCHAKVAASLSRALTAAHKVFPDVVAIYDGCYNNRSMRGGSIPSVHARGAAIDLWASANGNKVHWPTSARMPLGVMEAFAREGWLAAGAFWSRDAMHFQATT